MADGTIMLEVVEKSEDMVVVSTKKGSNKRGRAQTLGSEKKKKST